MSLSLSVLGPLGCDDAVGVPTAGLPLPIDEKAVFGGTPGGSGGKSSDFLSSTRGLIRKPPWYFSTNC